MIFHSMAFIVFLIVVLAVYWLLKRPAQNIFLLIASYYFYGYVHPWFLILIIISTLSAYFSGIFMDRMPDRKKFFLILSLVVNLGLLGVFKYFGFFVENISFIFQSLGLQTYTMALSILLPVGISFYTFQTLSYSIDLYFDRLSPRKNLLDFALFVSFFPQLVAGPIERASNLLPQIEKERTLTPDDARDAFFLILWGFFKKQVIADNVAITCNNIFQLEAPTFALLWTGVFAFTIQIYADFSAYTDIARGSAKLLGFNIVQNFNHPYLSKSPSEFWRRWHMSLSYWIRDYIYIPLGGSRGGHGRKLFNLIFTFFLCGLWHGASWNFVIWGVYHGVLIELHRISKNIVPERISKIKALQIPKVVFTFLLVVIGWLFFREQDFAYIIKYLSINPFKTTASELQVASYLFCHTLIYSLPLWAHAEYTYKIGPWLSAPENKTIMVILRTVFAIMMFIGILTMRSLFTTDFIYFQF